MGVWSGLTGGSQVAPLPLTWGGDEGGLWGLCHEDANPLETCSPPGAVALEVRTQGPQSFLTR